MSLTKIKRRVIFMISSLQLPTVQNLADFRRKLSRAADFFITATYFPAVHHGDGRNRCATIGRSSTNDECKIEILTLDNNRTDCFDCCRWCYMVSLESS